jgi:hypothetical protein
MTNVHLRQRQFFASLVILNSSFVISPNVRIA